MEIRQGEREAFFFFFMRQRLELGAPGVSPGFTVTSFKQLQRRFIHALGRESIPLLGWAR